jgi:hypothetical protein
MLDIEIPGEIAVMDRFHELFQLGMCFSLKFIKLYYLVNNHGSNDEQVNI